MLIYFVLCIKECFMNFTIITCPLCGNNNSSMFTQNNEQITCSYCNVSFVNEQFEDFNSKMDRYFDEQKQEKIANIKFNLYSAVHDQYKSIDKISTYARELKLLSPDDFLANFYDTVCNGTCSDVNTFLNDITNFRENKPFIADIVEFMLTSFEEANILSLKNLITNTFQDEEKIDLLTRLEDECAKLCDGMYASFIPRDVFVAYSSKDMVKVNKIVEYLESQDISCYLALRNLRHGKGAVENYQNELKNAMKHCKCVLFVSSKNSRSLGCDALKIELKYIQENLPKMKKIEYVIQDYDSSTTFAVKAFLKEFFKDLEHCRTLDDLSNRVFKIIMDYENPPTKKEEPKPTPIVIEEPKNPDFKYCQKCGNKNPYAAKFCKSCRFDGFFDTEEEYNNSKNMLYCKDCKNFNDSDSRFCLYCGESNLIKLSQPTIPTTPISKPQTTISQPSTPIISNPIQTNTYSPYVSSTASNVYVSPAPKHIQDKVKQGVSHYTIREYKKALEIFREAANYNDGQALLYMGLMYYYGLEVPKDYSIAVEWFKKGAEVNYPHAQSWLASCYKSGTGTPVDLNQTFYWASKAANGGNARAQNNLAYYYEYGVGVEKNMSKAIEWYTKSADAGDMYAQNNLGRLYYDGKGTSVNYYKAFEYYSKSANQGYVDAMNNLAGCYYNGRGTSVNYQKALEWYSKSAKEGNAMGQCWVGFCYRNGKGVAVDNYKAVEYYTKSANQGYARAQNNLGYCYETGAGVTQNLAKAIEWYTKGANGGDEYALNNLGLCYEKGKGVSVDNYKAFDCFKKAAEKGHKEAHTNLASCYYNGKGTTIDYNKAFEWYLKSANNGSALAQCWVGFCYKNGKGVTMDYYKAVEWYIKAANGGNARAQNNLAYCYEMGQGVAKNLTVAADWYLKGANNGDMYAQFNLALCYYRGKGVPVNLYSAALWFKKAADQGHTSAKDYLKYPDIKRYI